MLVKTAISVVYKIRPPGYQERRAETALIGFPFPCLSQFPQRADRLPLSCLSQFPKGDDRRIPVGVVATEFHVIVLYASHYDVLCLLNNKIVMNEGFPTQSTREMRGIAVDPVMERVFAFSPRTVYRIDAVNETRDAWQLYLDRGDFDKARRYCNDNPAHLDRVTTAEADSLFARGQACEAAVLYAKTRRSFEEVALRFGSMTQCVEVLT